MMFLSARSDGRLLEVRSGSGLTLKLMQDLGWIVEIAGLDLVAVENATRKGLQVRFGSLEVQ